MLCRSQLGGLNRDVSPTFEPVIPDESLASNPYKRQVLVTANTSHMERSISSKISLLLDRQHWLKGQLNIQVIGNTGHAWKVRRTALEPTSRFSYFRFDYCPGETHKPQVDTDSV